MAEKHRIFTTSVAKVYRFYLAKAEKKGRTKAEVDAIISWLTGYSAWQLEQELKKQTDFETFFEKSAGAPSAQSGNPRDDLRHSHRGDSGAADARDSLPRQIGRRTGERKSAGKVAARVVGCPGCMREKQARALRSRRGYPRKTSRASL
jgi:hypothetical protein